MPVKNNDFRTVIGVDDQGYFCVKLGHTTYAVLGDVVYTLKAGIYTIVPSDILAQKPWIMRNFREIMGYKATYMYRDERGYHIDVSGVHYIADVEPAYTPVLDKDFMGGIKSNKVFNWNTSLSVYQNCEIQPIDKVIASDFGFQREFKRVLNYQRTVDRRIAAQPKWHGKKERLEYKLKKSNTDAWGNDSSKFF